MEFKFADIGEGITEGEIVEWLVKEGAKVKADQVLCKIETDKAVVDMPSPTSGTIKAIKVKSGTVKVGETLVVIEDGKPTEAPVTKAAKVAVTKKMAPHTPNKSSGSVVGDLEEARDEPEAPGEKINLLGGVKPSENSVVGSATTSSTPLTSSNKPKVVRKYDLFGHVKREPVKGIRKATADNMAKSWKEIPHVTHSDEANIQVLWDLREKEKKVAKRKGIHLTFLPFIVKALVIALEEFPEVASEYVSNPEGDEIIRKKYYNIGIAVDKGEGLYVPVIKAAETKSIFKIAKEISELASKVEAKTLSRMDMQGGVITITNVGSVGGLFSTPIIKPGEAAILALGSIHDNVWIEEDEKGELKPVVAKVLPLSLSFDHRVIDGALAAKFVNEIIDLLDDPERLMME